MRPLENITEQQKDKIKKTAMHKLIPPCIRYFTKFPLTIAGKIELSRYPQQALEEAITQYDTSASPTVAFNEIKSLCDAYCKRHYRETNEEAVTLLRSLFCINRSQDVVQKLVPRSGKTPYEMALRRGTLEPVYISYFKLKDHLVTLNVSFPNPFKSRYEEYLNEALDSVDIDRETIEDSLYRLYLKQKAHDEVCVAGTPNPA